MPERASGPGSWMSPLKVLSGAVLLLWPMAVAWANPATVDVFANIRYSDNIDKRAEQGEDEFQHRVGVGIEKTTRPGRCEGALSGDVAFVTYQNDTNDDEVSGTVNANGQCQPNRNFAWSARDTLRDVRTTTTLPDSPGNRERRNVFATGPTFMVYPGPRDNLSLNIEYQNTRFQESDEDNSDRITTTGRWQHLFSTTLNGGATISRSYIEFEQTSEEITRDNASLFFNWRRPNGQWSGSVGYSWVESEQGVLTNESGGSTGELRYSHQWQGGTSGYIGVRRSLTDVSTDIDVRIPGLDLNLTQTSVVTVTAANAGLTQQWTARTSSNLSLSRTESDYERSGNTETRSRANLGVTHRLMSNLSMNASSGYTREQFGSGNDDIETMSGQVGLDYQRNRDLSVSASVGHELRDVVGGPGNEYHENWAHVGVRYNLR